jgi:EAL domain-containing protein (putative c-di-GMP-specific phosphodiesterase class I)/PAS domain-containing protein
MTSLLRRRGFRFVLTLVLTVMLGAMLSATIYFTQFDPQWIGFLGGVLFAAVLALASQISKTEWLMARRTRQLERARERLAVEVNRAKTATDAMRIAETRARLVADALPNLLLYVTRDERCQSHNRAFREWAGPDARVDGQMLTEVLGGEAYRAVAPRIAATLAGEAVDYELSLAGRTGPAQRYAVRQIPYAPEVEVVGFYLLLTPSVRPVEIPVPVAPSAAAAQAQQDEDEEDESSGHVVQVSQDGGETMYLRSLSQELMGKNPRAKLIHALQHDEFLLFAQKILAIKPGLPEPECYEILLRLQEEEANLLPPGGFLPVAERYGMMEDIDRWVVRSVINWCLLREKANPGWRMPLFCVNLSDAALANPEFARFVRKELQRPGFPSRALCFEIGEQEAIANHEAARRFITALKPSGCRFTMDAFGSGARVTFDHVKGLNLDFIKIDGVIIQNIVRDPAELAKAKAINKVCERIGMRTIAEFVETDETLAVLRSTGIDYVQGFGIARPGPIDLTTRKADDAA